MWALKNIFLACKLTKSFILKSWHTFVDIFLHRVFTCDVQARLLSIVTPSTLWFCTSLFYLGVHVGPCDSFQSSQSIYQYSFATRHGEWLSQSGDCASRYHLQRVHIKLLYTMASHLCTVKTIWALTRNLAEYRISALIGKIYGYRH